MTRREKEIALAKALGWEILEGEKDLIVYPSEIPISNPYPIFIDGDITLALLKELAKRCAEVELSWNELYLPTPWKIQLSDDQGPLFSCNYLSPEEAVFDAAYEAIVNASKDKKE